MTNFEVFILIFALFCIAIVLSIAIAMYILQSISLSKMSAKAGFTNPWLAWIPVAYYYAMGRLADKCKVEGEVKKFRLSILLLIFGIVSGGSGANFSIELPTAPIDNSTLNTFEENPVLIVLILFVMLILLTVMLASIAATIIYYMLYFKSFHRICLIFSPEHSKKYLIIAIATLGSAVPILFFLMRNKEPILPIDELPNITEPPILT